MDEETAAAILGLTESIANLAEAIQALNKNQDAIHTNVMRLSNRLAIHEAWAAVEQMDQPRAMQ